MLGRFYPWVCHAIRGLDPFLSIDHRVFAIGNAKLLWIPHGAASCCCATRPL
jgi:hypothetical protein